MANGRCRMHGGPSPGAPKGNKNALKHGRYTAEALARRRSIAALLAAMRSSAEVCENKGAQRPPLVKKQTAGQ
jgi:uncharacterized protein YjcR